MIENLHTHTVRCGHAKGTEEEFVQAAIAAGYETLGFADHAPHPFPTDYRSKVRMTVDMLDDYVQTVRSLARAYKDQISVPVGLEAEYYPRLFSQMRQIAVDAGVEYLILGQHYLDNEYDLNPLKHTFHESADPSVLDKYCRQVMDGMQTGDFTYICHPDVINFTGDSKIYDRHMRRLCQEANSCGLPLEINLWGMYHKKNYPLPHFWELAAEENCKVLLAADAHWPELVHNPECEAKALEMVERLGLTLLHTVPRVKLT